MQLSFLGKPYETSLPAIEASATPETGTFLGKPYVKKQFHVALRQMPTEALTYRGQRYLR